MIVANSKSFTDLVGFPAGAAGAVSGHGNSLEVHGTTVLSFRYKDGILNLADRRATAGNLVMYDQAEKIVALDDYTVISISGAFARSVEICRFLKHSLKYYRRITQHEMSLDGKLMEISRALSNNMSLAMQGIGAFVPIVAAYDKNKDDFGVYFFDGAGARFQNHSYACAGSGSERIRGLFEYLTRSKGAWETRPLDEVLFDGLQMLDIAADLDSATGGFSKFLPIARVLDKDGNRPVPEAELRKVVDKILKAQPRP